MPVGYFLVVSLCSFVPHTRTTKSSASMQIRMMGSPYGDKPFTYKEYLAWKQDQAKSLSAASTMPATQEAASEGQVARFRNALSDSSDASRNTWRVLPALAPQKPTETRVGTMHRATVPAGLTGGMQMVVNTRGGPMAVRIPNGLSEGMSFEFVVPTASSVVAADGGMSAIQTGLEYVLGVVRATVPLPRGPSLGSSSPAQQMSGTTSVDEPNLMQKVKDAGVAGIVSYMFWELAFWGVSIPVCVVGYYQVTGHWPDLSDSDDAAKLGAEAFAFVNLARFAVPLRIGLALSTVPWVQQNVIDRFSKRS